MRMKIDRIAAAKMETTGIIFSSDIVIKCFPPRFQAFWSRSSGGSE
jgi:hypothetical protein